VNSPPPLIEKQTLGFAVKWGYLDRMPEIPDVVVPEPSFDWYLHAFAWSIRRP
jgi:hypothetical protein